MRRVALAIVDVWHRPIVALELRSDLGVAFSCQAAMLVKDLRIQKVAGAANRRQELGVLCIALGDVSRTHYRSRELREDVLDANYLDLTGCRPVASNPGIT